MSDTWKVLKRNGKAVSAGFCNFKPGANETVEEYPDVVIGLVNEVMANQPKDRTLADVDKDLADLKATLKTKGVL